MQGEAGTDAIAAEVDAVAAEVESAADSGTAEEAADSPVEDSFVTVPAVAATLTGDEVVALASSSEPLVITEDTPLTAAEAPANIIPPAITGTARGGEAVTTDTGFWAGTSLTYSYQWQRCTSAGAACEDIADTTSATYTLTGAEVGSVVRVVVSASGADGSASVSSAPTDVVAPGAAPEGAAPVEAPESTADPTVSGTAEPGQVLAATPGTWSGGDLAYSYQWQRCSKRFRTTALLADSPLGFWRLGESAGATAVDASPNGPNGHYVGNPSYGVAGVTSDGNTGVNLDGKGTVEVPGIVGSAFLSGISLEAWLKVSSSPLQTRRGIVSWRYPGVGGIRLWLDEDGDYGLAAGPGTPTYLRTAVAPTAGYWEHLVGTWDGSMLHLYRNGVLIGSQALSALGDPAVSLKLGTYQDAPGTLKGALDEVAVYGKALSAGEVRGHYSGCEDIPGATEATYTATANDLNLPLRASVRATNTAGTATSGSAQTGTVTARPPVASTPPAVIGTVEEGQTLRAANGIWGGTPPFTFTYQWRRCDAAGAYCSDIAGATDTSYTAGPDDVGHTVRARIYAQNLAEKRYASSPPTETVLDAPEPLPAFKQHWPYVAGVATMLADPAAHAGEPPTIAIVDSGIDTSRADFGGRVIEQVTKTERSPNSPGDGYGHGTAVASVAAGDADGYRGAAPGARLVSIDVLDDNGVANLSEVIAAADWIYENRVRLNIRVANFSLHGTTLASLVSDPLDKAVERLWQSGIVVVTAAGNYARDGAESAVAFAPANDPFVITVGATDTLGTFTPRDDVPAPWSAWGYTRDGFAKPELVAPGRYIAAAVPPGSKLANERPDRVVEPGYLQLSGTSLAAPVIAGTAATILREHPNWTPDDVKGALMLTTAPLPDAAPRSTGVGAVAADKAAKVIDPPNPNLALNQFLVPDPAGAETKVFDTDAWTQAVESDVAWGSVAWGSVAWGSAAWSSVAWGSVAWGSVAWGSVAWGSVAWGSVAWGSVAWGSTAKDDLRPGGAYWVRRN